MTKKQIVRLHNILGQQLHETKLEMIKFIEGDMGGEWVDHGTDDNDRSCYILKGRTLGVSTGRYDVDCEVVPLSIFLSTLVELCSE
jgi:hypothetical protein